MQTKKRIQSAAAESCVVRTINISISSCSGSDSRNVLISLPAIDSFYSGPDHNLDAAAAERYIYFGALLFFALSLGGISY